MQDYFGAKTGENQQFWHIKQTPKTHFINEFWGSRMWRIVFF